MPRYFYAHYVYNCIYKSEGGALMADFGSIMKLLRAEKGMSQQEIADALKVSKSAINMYERGERQPNFETMELIADYFNVDLDYLYGRSNIRKKVHFDKDGNEYTLIDSDLSIIQRERSKMSNKEKIKLMNILKANFDDYNWEEDDSGDIE